MLRRRFAEELEARVASATRSVRELDQAKSEFVSVVSHELRTPLTALVGFAELLLTREVPAERARRWLGHVHGEAQRLARIVGDLLDLSRIESGAALDLAGRAPVDLGAVVERNVDLFATAHPRHHFTACARADRPVVVPADADAIDRVVKNLLSNAVKYSPAGGRVTVSVRAAAVSPPMVEIAVEDEGVGIPPEALARIFDRYVRVADPATGGVRGLGLGLSLVRTLVEAHGGRVSAASEPGRGSRFSVLLPG
jgi:signal transduction histidine kinase